MMQSGRGGQSVGDASERLGRLLRRIRRPAWLGTVRRTSPLSEAWGRDRGTPVDRFYIDQFLVAQHEDIRGRALEVRDSRYLDRFGEQVTRREILDIDSTNPRATVVADLAAADAIPADSFDSIVLTQTLQYIPEVGRAIDHVQRILAPGGVLLATVPGISRIGRRDLSTDHWRFTPASCQALFGAAFGVDHVTVTSYGNVLAAVAFLLGMAREELKESELEHHDPHFPVILAIRAEKAWPANQGSP